MSTSLLTALDPGRPVVEQLRERVTALERRSAAEPVPTLPGIADLLTLHAGAAYAVDSPSLALALAAGASRAGAWVGFAGCPDFGAEAVLRVVVLRPPARVDERAAGVLDSRLRRRSAVLVVHGQWPRVAARLSIEESAWSGPAAGAGHLEERRARVAVHRGARPAQHAELTWPGLRRVDRPAHEVLRAHG
jgi:hypothetical protein